MTSWQQPTREQVEKAVSLSVKEVDRRYFYSRLKNPLWLPVLIDVGVFNSPPPLIEMDNNTVRFTLWPELLYLHNIADKVPDEVIDLLVNLPKSNNPAIYDGVLQTAQKIQVHHAEALLPKVLEYLNLKRIISEFRFVEIIGHWIKLGELEPALVLFKELVPFRRDSWHDRTAAPSSEKVDEYTSSPKPRFDKWEYDRLMSYVTPLTVYKPLAVSAFLIECVDQVLVMSNPLSNRSSGRDLSYYWYPRLEIAAESGSRGDDLNWKQTLCHGVVQSCLVTVEQGEILFSKLVSKLDNTNWMFLIRLKNFLVANVCYDSSLPIISEAILEFSQDPSKEMDYELMLLIKHGVSSFGHQVVSDETIEKISECVLKGPSEREFRDWLGDDYSAGKFKDRQGYYHSKQLYPFYSMLTNERQLYLDGIEVNVTEESYALVSYSSSGFIEYKSPVNEGGFEQMSFHEQLYWLNEWQSKPKLSGAQTSVEALSKEFQSYLAKDDSWETIEYWSTKASLIKRPVFVRSIIDAISVKVANGCDFDFQSHMTLFNKVIANETVVTSEGYYTSDEIIDMPSWHSCHLAIVDLIKLLVNEVEFDLVANAPNFDLLFSSLFELSRSTATNLDLSQVLTEAINSEIGKIIECYLDYGEALNTSSKVPLRLNLIVESFCNKNIEMTPRVASILGLHFYRLHQLSPDTFKLLTLVIHKAGNDCWSAWAYSAIMYNNPSRKMHSLMRQDFDALTSINKDNVRSEFKEGEFPLRVGVYQFLFYVWGELELSDVQQTHQFHMQSSKFHIRLFTRIADVMGNGESVLNNNLITRIVAFLEWRLSIGNCDELRGMTHWFSTNCLPEKLRVDAYLTFMRDCESAEIESGYKVYETCLKLIKGTKSKKSLYEIVLWTLEHSENIRLYVGPERVMKRLISEGLNSHEDSVHDIAFRIKEVLLNAGRFEYLDLDLES